MEAGRYPSGKHGLGCFFWNGHNTCCCIKFLKWEWRQPIKPQYLPETAEGEMWVHSVPQMVCVLLFAGLFIVDGHYDVYVWEGWMPEDDDDVRTGSGRQRWDRDRRLAMETALNYAKGLDFSLIFKIRTRAFAQGSLNSEKETEIAFLAYFWSLEKVYRVPTGPGNPGKSWNFILAFSRTGKSWKSNIGRGKSWKSINSCKKVFFVNNCLQYYFWISIS